MNEENKTNLRVASYVLAAVILIAGSWFLLRDYRTGSGSNNDIESGFNAVEKQQQAASRDINDIEKGVDDSQNIAAEIGSSIGRSQDIATGIAESESAAVAGLADAENTADRIANDAAAITESNSRAKGRIDTAIEENGRAAEQIDRAIELGDQCAELNQSSESIFARYAQ